MFLQGATVLLVSLSMSAASLTEASTEGEICKSNEKPGAPITSNGCSKPDFIQVGGEEDFTYCCDRHDACYSMCGVPKSFCDDDFKHCMLKQCSNEYSSNKQCPSAAQMYAMGTMMFGQEGYHDSQKNGCMCVEVASMREHYTSLVTSFYETHAPEKAPGAVEAMDTFLSKHADVPGAQPAYPYSKLYYTLHKKYGEQAIVRVKGGSRTDQHRDL